MTDTFSNIDKFHHTRKGKLIFGVVELLLSYAIISRAIDTGSLWEWGVGLLFVIGGINNLIRVLGRQIKKDEKSKPKRK